MTDRYRKKPVVIEAMQFDGTEDSFEDVAEWMASHGEDLAATLGKVVCLHIFTLEVEMLAVPGDYIIRGVQGEFYPCKPDIFEATYELVEGDR